MDSVKKKKETEDITLYIIKSDKKDWQVYSKCINEIHEVGKDKAQCLNFDRIDEKTFHYRVDRRPRVDPYRSLPVKKGRPTNKMKAEKEIVKKKKAKQTKEERKAYKREYDRKRFLRIQKSIVDKKSPTEGHKDDAGAK